MNEAMKTEEEWEQIVEDCSTHCGVSVETVMQISKYLIDYIIEE